MTYYEIIKKVSEDTGLSYRMVNRIYKAYWRAIKEHITSLPLKEDITEDEFRALQPNINIPSIGKLYVSWDKYKYKREKYKSDLERYATH